MQPPGGGFESVLVILPKKGSAVDEVHQPVDDHAGLGPGHILLAVEQAVVLSGDDARGHAAGHERPVADGLVDGLLSIARVQQCAVL